MTPETITVLTLGVTVTAPVSEVVKVAAGSVSGVVPAP